MKTLPSGLQDFLDGGETTMVHAWKVTRVDGVVQGFTEHDNDLTFDGITYIASSGFTSSRIESSLGLSTDNLNVDGAISDDTLNSDDLSSGNYDDAVVELWWVNFENVSQRVLLNKGNVGQVKRGELAFSAELRSQSGRLQQQTGRVYQRTCDAILGDSRCKVDLTAFTSNGTIQIVNSRRDFEVSISDNDTDSFYSFGVITFTSGENSGLKFEIKSHSSGRIFLWEKTPFSVGVDDTFSVVAGCDKKMSTCNDKFSNTANFQGFNLVPGSDFITRYVPNDEDQGGESIFS